MKIERKFESKSKKYKSISKKQYNKIEYKIIKQQNDNQRIVKNRIEFNRM